MVYFKLITVAYILLLKLTNGDFLHQGEALGEDLVKGGVLGIGVRKTYIWLI